MDYNRGRRPSGSADVRRTGTTRPAGSQVRRSTGTTGTRQQTAAGRYNTSEYGEWRRTSGSVSRSASVTRTTAARPVRSASNASRGTAGVSRQRVSGDSRRAVDPRVAQARRRAQIRRRKQQRKLMIIGVGAVLLIVIIVIALNLGNGKKDNKATGPSTMEVVDVSDETVPEIMIETPDSEETADEPPVEDTSAADIPAAPAATTTYCDYVIRDGIPNTVDPIGIGECEQVDDSYFDDAVFVGDSVTLGLSKIVKNQRKENLPNLLGTAQFLTCGGMGIRDALRPVSEKSLHPSYQGEKMLVEDALALMGAKKIFLMLGMNDIVMASTEENVQNMMSLLARIREKNPGAIIFIESCTPRAVGEYKKLNNNALFEFDIALYEECKKYEDKGLYFIDIEYALRDDQGWLPEEFCGDLGSQRLHMSSKGVKAWVSYLYTHALRDA